MGFATSKGRWMNAAFFVVMIPKSECLEALSTIVRAF